MDDILLNTIGGTLIYSFCVVCNLLRRRNDRKKRKENDEKRSEERKRKRKSNQSKKYGKQRICSQEEVRFPAADRMVIYDVSDMHSIREERQLNCRSGLQSFL